VIEPAERSTESDDSMARAEQWLERALARQRLRAEREAPALVAGTCQNCLEQPIVGLYCDDDCRADAKRRGLA
jgi:hypothetical protein